MLRLAIVPILLCSISNAQETPASLYDRLGRYDAISQIVDGYLNGIRSARLPGEERQTDQEQRGTGGGGNAWAEHG